MPLKIAARMLLLVALATTSGAYAASCDDPKTNDEIAQCLGVELREADARINAIYKELMATLSDADKTTLRTAQRTWIKERDATCRLDTKESNRERWYQALLRDYPQTVCVTRYTRRRTAELESLLSSASQPGKAESKPAAPVRATSPANADKAYDSEPPTSHAAGKWYFEITLNPAEIVRIEPCALTAGVWTKSLQSGVLENVRKRDAERPIVTIGFAIDIDNGKLYTSRNGAWANGQPGSNEGMNIKPNDAHFAGIQTSAEEILPYLKSRAIVANYGGTPMTYALPAGYSPWKNRTQGQP